MSAAWIRKRDRLRYLCTAFADIDCYRVDISAAQLHPTRRGEERFADEVIVARHTLHYLINARNRWPTRIHFWIGLAADLVRYTLEIADTRAAQPGCAGRCS